jgi:hypothetical protein
MVFTSSDRLAPSTLYSSPTSPAGEILRWSLSLHRTPFTSKLRPFIPTPLLITAKAERITGYEPIMCYLFAHSWGSGVLLYPTGYSEMSDGVKEACERVYVACLMEDVERLIGSVTLAKHQSVCRLFMPVIKIYLRRKHGVNQSSVLEAWELIETTFKDMEASVPPSKDIYTAYLNGAPTISVSDLELATYASLILFPGVEDTQGSLSIPIPETRAILEQSIPAYRARAKALRESATGRYALYLIRERSKGKNCGIQEGGKYDRGHGNPLWSEYHVLRSNFITGIMLVVFSGGAILLLHGIVWFSVSIACLMVIVGVLLFQLDLQTLLIDKKDRVAIK